MFKILSGALALAAVVGCSRDCDVQPTPTPGTDSVIVTGGDTVIVTGGDSVIITGGDSVTLAADEPRRTIICRLTIRDKNPPVAGKKRIYWVDCAPRP